MGIPAFETGLTVVQTETAFNLLQQKLAPLWESIESINNNPQTIVVIPSITVDYPLSGALLQAYEERLLFLLFLLKQPQARLIYVTSQTILPTIVDYYLHLLPGVIASHARKRLFLLSPFDGSPQPLSLKILKRPTLINKIRSLTLNPDRAHMIPFNTTPLERDLAIQLGIPMYASDPKFFEFGTKSGCRQIFSDEGVTHPLGENNLYCMNDLIAAIKMIRQEKPKIRDILVKLNEGVSGDGNAFVTISDMPASECKNEDELICEQIKKMTFEAPDGNFDQYMQKLEFGGGIIEERISGKEFRSPSVQMRITPLGNVEVLSTHDQILGGSGGQTFEGCRFPADSHYSMTITNESLKVGHRLAKEGVLGRFAIDFVVTKNNDNIWEAYAIEINLRKGGTTHPFLTLQFLTDGEYDEEHACFNAPNGKQKYFIATDYLKSESFRLFTPDDLFDIIVQHNLHFDQSLQTGVVLHMISAIGEIGRFGFTAVGNSSKEAENLYTRTVKTFEDEAERKL